MLGFNALSTFVQLCFVLYIALAVLYTSASVFFVPLGLRLPKSLAPRFSPQVTVSESYTSGFDTWSRATRHNNLASVPAMASPTDRTVDDFLFWPTTNLSGERSGSFNRKPMQETTFLSYAFAGAMHPTRIIPFYYKALGTIDADDVTITTIVTSNRFTVFKQLVERYQGPISVTIYIPLPPDLSIASLPPTHPSAVSLRDLHELYRSSPYFATYVDVHLALSPFGAVSLEGNSAESDGGRQFNMWRNAARLFARTEFVMMLDVDFAVCTDWRSAVRDSVRSARDIGVGYGPAQDQHSNNSIPVMQKLREGTAALVVPAFEYVKQEDGLDQSKFPEDKEHLLLLATATPPVMASFHASWAPGHNSTDYTRYYEVPPESGTVYKVTNYQSAYEPYVIMSKRVSWCDERFTGYGGNKAACLFEIYLSGVSFYVLADHFLIHQSHKYEEEARREERKYNRKLYLDFKEETCLRYLYRFHMAGTLNTARGFNVQEECKKLKNVAKIAAQLIEG